MNTNNIKAALQDMIIRLQDSEKGYNEIAKTVGSPKLKSWMKSIAKERHNMHKLLEGHVTARGGDPEVKTSFLGDLHRIFIDIKLNSMEDNHEAIMNEIKRGSSVLINDYDKILNEVKMPVDLLTTIQTQKITVQEEIKVLDELGNDMISLSS